MVCPQREGYSSWKITRLFQSPWLQSPTSQQFPLPILVDQLISTSQHYAPFDSGVCSLVFQEEYASKLPLSSQGIKRQSNSESLLCTTSTRYFSCTVCIYRISIPLSFKPSLLRSPVCQPRSQDSQTYSPIQVVPCHHPPHVSPFSSVRTTRYCSTLRIFAFILSSAQA